MKFGIGNVLTFFSDDSIFWCREFEYVSGRQLSEEPSLMNGSSRDAGVR